MKELDKYIVTLQSEAYKWEISKLPTGNKNLLGKIIIIDVKAKTDKTQKLSECRLCGDRDETINPLISECGKLA